MNKTAKYITIVLAVIIVILLGILIFVNPPQKKTAPAGSGIAAPSYPTSPDGHVQIFGPTLGQEIISPAAISGSVTGGGWFFEGTFPVEVVDAAGIILGVGQATAPQGEWMSTGTVLFTGDISFSASHSATGTIIFSKDDPSGLPQNKESFSVPVRF